MPQNNKFISLRKRLGPSQLEFAEKLGVSRSTIADIERGRIGVSKRVKEKIVEKYPTESGYFDGNKDELNVEVNQGNKSGLTQGLEAKNSKTERNKYTYMYQFRQLLESENKQLSELSKDVSDILSLREALEELHETKIGNALFFGVENLKEVNSFKAFKELGFQALNEVLPYNAMLHEFAEAGRKFVKELRIIKDEINMDFDFGDFFWQESKNEISTDKS